MSWVNLSIKSPYNVLWFNKADSWPTVAQPLAGRQFFWGAVLYFFHILFTWKDRTLTQDNWTVLIFMNFLIYYF